MLGSQFGATLLRNRRCLLSEDELIGYFPHGPLPMESATKTPAMQCRVNRDAIELGGSLFFQPGPFQ